MTVTAAQQTTPATPSRRTKRMVLFPRVDDAPDLALDAFRDVQRAVRRLRHAVRARGGVELLFDRSGAGEAVGEDFAVARRLATGERLERHVVAVLRHRRAVPR